MRKLLTLVLTALAFSAAPVAGQVSVRAFTWTGEGTFENLTCARIPAGDYCFYSQGDGEPSTSNDFAIYPLTDLTPVEGADLCWLMGMPQQLRGNLATPEARAWGMDNMVGRRFCVYFAPGMVVDIGDGMQYLQDPAAEQILMDLLTADDEVNQKGGTLFPTT